MSVKRFSNGSIKASVLNTRVLSFKPLIPPSIVQEEMPLTREVQTLIIDTRKEVASILKNQSDKLLCVVGPCSIHDYDAAIDYAKRLKELSNKYKDSLLILMRVYFEKPRTTVGWKGLINDPNLDGTFEINKGIKLARKILLDINSLGVPCACEFLDSISPQFISDLVCWGAIGARTTESQIHRELASGLSCPIGFKNGTGGSLKLAVDAILSASSPHNFMGVNDQGLAAVVRTTGNDCCHIVLRGGSSGPNYSAKHIQECLEMLRKNIGNQHDGIIVDCSHANSMKQYKNQPKVIEDISKQISDGEISINGVMIESNIVEGNQKLSVGKTDPKTLVYGKSVTDECVNLEMTESMLVKLVEAVQNRVKTLSKKAS